MQPPKPISFRNFLRFYSKKNRTQRRKVAKEFIPTILRLSLSLSLSLSLLLPFAIPAQLHGQQYRSIKPHHEIYPIDFNTSENIGLMINMVPDNDGYLWISTSRGLVVYDGSNSIMYNPDDPKFPMGSKDISTNYYGVRKNKGGNIIAITSPLAIILEIDPQRRVPVHQFNLRRNDEEIVHNFDVSDHGEVISINYKVNSDSVFVITGNVSGETKVISTFDKKETGDVISFDCFHDILWIQTTKGILRIRTNGQVLPFFSFGKQPGAGWFPMHDENYFYFFDSEKPAIMYWSADQPAPKVFAIVPERLRAICNYVYVDRNLAYTGGGTNLFILDTLARTIEDISHQFYNLKANDLPGSLSEDMGGFCPIEGRLYYLGNKNLYAFRDLPPQQSVFRDSLPPDAVHASMRGLAEDDHQNVYASYYNNITVKSAKDSHFKSFELLKNVNTKLYSAYNLTFHDHFLFWHSLSIDLHSGSIKQIIPNITNGHVAQLLDHNILWMYTWYSDHFYAYDISTGHLDSIPIEQKEDLSKGFPSVINTMIQSDDPSAIWLATRLDGICLIGKNGKLILKYSHEQLGTSIEEGICDISLFGNEMWYGCLDGLGKLNILTGEHTLYRDPVMKVNGQQQTRTVFSILPDKKGGFYLGTNNGLVYFDTLTKEYFHLDPSHPMAQNEYNRTSAFRDSAGRYYFGTTNGLYSFMPEELDFEPVSDTIRPLRLYSISIFNGREKKYRYLSSELFDLKKLELRPYETNIEFSFSVANFEKNIYYSYRVKGLDDKWSDYSADNHILVYSLPPGSYRLEIKASTNARDENASFYSIEIKMHRYWYRNAWVIAFFIILISGLVAFVIRYRFQQKWKRQQALENLRIHISSDLHDDVGSILSGLAMQSQVMSFEVPEDQKKSMLDLSAMSREAMERMRDTVWAIDSRKDKFENLIDRMRDFAEKNLERKNITHEFIIDGVDGKKFINPEVRQNIYLIFKEAITNIIKHSDAGHVKISFLRAPNQMRLIIHDNGSKNEMSKSDGLGLSNMQMRAKKIGAKLTIKYDDGFKVELVI